MHAYHSIHCIVPPHMLEQIIKNGLPEQADKARKTFAATEQLRRQRQNIDSTSSSTLSRDTSLQGKIRTVYDAQNGLALPGVVARSEGEPPVVDEAINEAYEGSSLAYDLYSNIYGRDSIDNIGMQLNSTVHYGKGYDNAFWDGQQMIYGDGDEDLPPAQCLFNRFTISIDVIGHELTHGVIENEVKLNYQGQSGALSESISDVFGSLVKQYQKKQTAADADWIIGEGLFTSNVNGVGIRSMKAPGTAYDDPVLGKDPQPADMAHYVNTALDNGGVHINSGIPNRAFYLVATAIGGYAWEKAGRIWYMTLRDKLTATSDFQAMSNLTIQTAGELYGVGSLEFIAVIKGWEQVGISVGAAAPTPIPVPSGAFPNLLEELLKKISWGKDREAIDNEKGIKTFGNIEAEEVDGEGEMELNEGRVYPSPSRGGGQHAKPPLREPGQPSREKSSSRVLNANFAHLPRMQKLRKKEGLAEGEACSLLVEIGPRWKKGESITSGKIDLTQVLAGDDDYIIQAVFVSDDFEPKMTSADIWVPAGGGRTFPYINGQKAEKPGPVVLSMGAPHIPKENQATSMTVRGRLCLYYKSYLLQSAVVSVGIVRDAAVQLEKNNEIKVDFVLTGNFQEVRKRFQNRRIRFDEYDQLGKPVTLNLTLNDDGYGQHRILAKHHLDEQKEIGLPPAWKKYDPIAGINILAQFRDELLSCYAEFDPRKFRNKREKFIADLTSLAVIGSKLYAAAFSDLTIPDGTDAWDWEEQLHQSISAATVIQVSRTGPATYVFPWAMIYEYPLEEGMRTTYVSCLTLWDEWDENAVRTKKAEMQCPHQNEHLEKMRQAKEAGKTVSIICPYAFWGYKHIIEQPLSAVDQLSSAPDHIATGGKFELSIGITHDLKQPDNHLGNLIALLPQAHLDPQDPADDREEVRQMLRAPQVVYFLCHGEKDKGQTYISIGEHDADPMHMVTPNMLKQWKRSSVDKSAWQRIHPLIFINGCGTADLRPGLAFDLVSAFAELEASGVIGTEVSIQTTTAYPAALTILRRLAEGGKLCPTIREMRWELLNQGDLLGLAYTPYGLAELHIE